MNRSELDRSYAILLRKAGQLNGKMYVEVVKPWELLSADKHKAWMSSKNVADLEEYAETIDTAEQFFEMAAQCDLRYRGETYEIVRYTADWDLNDQGRVVLL